MCTDTCHNLAQSEVMRLDKECSEFKGMDASGKGASTKMMMTYMHTFSDDWWKSIDGGGYATQLHPHLHSTKHTISRPLQ